MVQAPARRTTAPTPRHPDPHPDYGTWPQSAREYIDQLNALNDALTTTVNEQNRVIQSLRRLLGLEEED